MEELRSDIHKVRALRRCQKYRLFLGFLLRLYRYSYLVADCQRCCQTSLVTVCLALSGSLLNQKKHFQRFQRLHAARFVLCGSSFQRCKAFGFEINRVGFSEGCVMEMGENGNKLAIN
jgi:hypothetical protein